ncbi:MAG: hypothetical protein H6502_00400 [Candidatus Woesearchaeota archaeon]|nr:MAG: hypothetical protein H6502_00400 [Candidatus Woesearchaeota archaeon]
MKKLLVSILIVLVLIGGGILFAQHSYPIEDMHDRVLNETLEGTTNNVPNAQLVDIATQYVQTPPEYIRVGNGDVLWNETDRFGVDLSPTRLSWILAQQVKISYTEPEQFSSPYEEYNDKYAVSWFFIPGCTENPASESKPNWFNDQGVQCLGGYSLRVLINPDLTVFRAEMQLLN